MSMLDGILGQIGGGVDIASLAAKVGIDPATAEKAVAALGAAHPQPGDTVATAAQSTGIDSGTLTRILDQIGGEGALSKVNQLLQNHPQAAGLFAKLDQDGDGNPLNDAMGMMKGLFGKT